MDYRSKLATLSNRYNPEGIPLTEVHLFSATEGDVVRYVKRAMSAVEDAYTKKTKEAGEAAKEHLSRELGSVSFGYQGSVMTDTHIKGASDIDLLVMCEKFYDTEIHKVRQELQDPSRYYSYQERSRLSSYAHSFSPYCGNSYDDLASLRMNIERIMRQTYSECDTSHPKAVKIRNKHLHRDVDIVTASWHHSLDYILAGQLKENRGIKIYNKDKRYAEGPDFPFLGISRINSRSAETQGRLKRMIRFLKNVRTDSDYDIPLTSFDINAICYSIPVRDYISDDYKELVNVLWQTLHSLYHDNKANQLKSVVGDEYVFWGKPQKLEALRVLSAEVFNIRTELQNL
jgi:hypothetical protein